MTTSTSAPQNRARPAGKSAVTPLREPSVIVDDLHVSYRVPVPGTRTGGVSAALPRLMREEPPVLSGELVLIDRSGRVAPGIVRKISEAARTHSGLELRSRELSSDSNLENEKQLLARDGQRLALAAPGANWLSNPRSRIHVDLETAHPHLAEMMNITTLG